MGKTKRASPRLAINPILDQWAGLWQEKKKSLSNGVEKMEQGWPQEGKKDVHREERALATQL